MKKILTGVLALALSCSMCTGVFAEAYGTGITKSVMPISETTVASQNEAEENKLRNVLTAVKTVIDIPEEYTEFDYNLYTRYENETWNLTWRTEDYSKNITVSCDSEGRITSYNNNIPGKTAKAPVIRKAEAMEIALGFIEKVYPGVRQSLKEEKNTYSYFGSGSYEFYFVREENGITYSNNYAGVSVDYIDGRVKNMYIEWQPDAKFDSPENVISPNMVQKIWKNDSDMQLKYRIFNTYDENGETIGAVAKLIYLNNTSQKDINAFDGEYYVQNYSWADKNAASDMIFGTVTEESAEAEAGGVRFNENELKKMEELAGYIKIEEADKNVRAYKQLAMDDTYKLASYSTGYYYSPYTSSKDRPIVWNLQYTAPVKEGDFYTTNANATVDAKSGKVLSFSTYIEHNWFDGEGNFCPPELKVTEDEAKKIANEFLGEICPEKAQDLSLTSTTSFNNFTYKAENYGKEDAKDDGSYYTSLRMSYDRTKNGIPVIGNTATVIVNCITGKITEYSVRWTENIDFTDIEAKIDASEAVNAYFENGKTDLRYVLHTVYLYDEKADGEQEIQPVKPSYSANSIETRKETRLVYTFSCPFYAISAVSGKALDYSGNEYVQEQEAVFNGFGDIAGHWAQEKIELLSDIGVVISSESFTPDAPITQKEFIAMLMACINRRPEVYRFEHLDGAVPTLISNMTSREYYIPEKDADIDPDAPLMRKDAAKFIMRALGYETIATIPGIFTTDFADNAEIDPAYIGYAALAKGLGIISGSHGRFNGNENLTKAECVILVYNYLNADK
ncbi:MAG: S-layer homology domain-containing protein [Clostridia bacterium]|nr:S-layer homology domain-containing protein [Clostridia bacterium]